jgi:hypothetical protein
VVQNAPDSAIAKESWGFHIHLNESEDALSFVPLYERYISQYLMGLPVTINVWQTNLAADKSSQELLDAHYWG